MLVSRAEGKWGTLMQNLNKEMHARIKISKQDYADHHISMCHQI